jgi:hypothetical protein
MHPIGTSSDLIVGTGTLEVCSLHLSAILYNTQFAFCLQLSPFISGSFFRQPSTIFKPLTPELNPSAQYCLPRFFTGDFNF